MLAHRGWLARGKEASVPVLHNSLLLSCPALNFHAGRRTITKFDLFPQFYSSCLLIVPPFFTKQHSNQVMSLTHASQPCMREPFYL